MDIHDEPQSGQPASVPEFEPIIFQIQVCSDKTRPICSVEQMFSNPRERSERKRRAAGYPFPLFFHALMKTVAALHLTFITTLEVHKLKNVFKIANKQQKHFK
jgi:hypothetical protein